MLVPGTGMNTGAMRALVLVTVAVLLAGGVFFLAACTNQAKGFPATDHDQAVTEAGQATVDTPATEKPGIGGDDGSDRSEARSTAPSAEALPRGERTPPADTTSPPPVEGTPRERLTPAGLLPIEATVVSAEQVRSQLAASGVKPVLSAELGLWDYVLLGRFLALDDLVAKYSTYYGTDYIWQLMIFGSESTLDPIAKGPEPGDRGIGQVSYESERTTRAWGTDPSNPYFSPDLDPEGSIWDPETNIIMATIVLRSIYAVPGVTTNQHAYAIYTDGFEGIDPHGNFIDDTLRDIGRADSFRERLLGQIHLKVYANWRAAEGSEARMEHAAAERRRRLDELPDSVVRRFLEIDHSYRDGPETYRALRDFYIDASRQAVAQGSVWAVATYLNEALILTKLCDVVYGDLSLGQYEQILAILGEAKPMLLGVDEPAIERIYKTILSGAQQAIANEGRYTGFPFNS